MGKDPRKLFINYNRIELKLKLIWRICYRCRWRGTKIKKNGWNEDICPKFHKALTDIKQINKGEKQIEL